MYARRRLGPFWGYLAGWAFVVGKSASCAAMALTFASYAAPGHERLVGALAVVVLTGVNYVGVQKSAWATRGIVAVVLLVLAFVVVVAACFGGQRPGCTSAVRRVHGVLQAAGLLFFAFAGYARIATLGEEVRDPARTIPRAIPIALGIMLVVYAAVAVATLAAIGPDGVAASAAPLHEAVATVSWASPVVRVGAAVAALGSLLALLSGVSRTTLRDVARRPSATRARRGASSFPGAAPRGTRGGRGDPRPRAHDRPARCDRLLVLRRAPLLRAGERLAHSR